MNLNAGKLGVTLDLGDERGRQIFRDLVRWADVVTESFSPKAMRAWGLDYPALKQIKPDIIMVRHRQFTRHANRHFRESRFMIGWIQAA